MRRPSYVRNLLDYARTGKSLDVVPYRPLSLGMLERMVEFWDAPWQYPLKRKKYVLGTKMLMTRAGLLVDRIENGKWEFLLGRSIPMVEDPRRIEKFKLAGGYTRFFPSMHVRDESIFEGLVREIREEGFKGLYSVRKKTLAPMNVIPALPEGILVNFTGSMPRIPRGKRDRPTIFTTTDYDKIAVKYFSIEDILSEALDKDEPCIKPETILASFDMYLWNRSTKVKFNPWNFKHVTPHGHLRLPDHIRSYILKKAGYSDIIDQAPDMSDCRVYVSTPYHSANVPSLRMFLVSDLFVYQKEFLTEELTLSARAGIRAKDKNAGRAFVKEYLAENLNRILHKELFSLYLTR